MQVKRSVTAMEFCLLASLVLVAGCGAEGTANLVVAKELVADQVAQRAIEAYDSNGDGALDKEELSKCPALSEAVQRIDTDKSGSLSAAEITARMQALQQQSDLLPLSVHVEHRNRPLVGAQVEFAPESFVGAELPAFSGKTDESGRVSPRNEQLSVPGLPLGWYRVSITSADGSVNETLGCEVAEDTRSAGRLTFSL